MYSIDYKKVEPEKKGIFPLFNNGPLAKPAKTVPVYTKAGTRDDSVAPAGVLRLPLSWYCNPLKVDMSVLKKS